MKKLIALLVVIVIIVASPLVTSSITKSYFEDQVELVKEIPGYTLEILEYNQGYLSSQAKISVGLDMNTEQMTDVDEDELELFRLFEKGITLAIDINHGPVVFKPNFAFALSHYSVTFDEDQEFVKTATETLGVDQLFNLDVIVSYGGDQLGVLAVSPFDYTSDEGSLTFGGINLDIDSKNFGTTATVNGTMEQMVINNPLASVTIAPATITGSSERAEDIMLSPGTFAITFPKITFSGMDSGEIENLRMSGKSTLSADKLMNFYLRYSVDHFQSAMSGMSISDAVIDFGFENLNGDALMELSRASQDMALLEDLEQDPTVMMNLMGKFLEDSPKLVIKELAYSLNDVPNLSLSGNLGINSAALSKPVTLDNPFLLIGAVESQLDATLHQNLVSQAIQLVALRQTESLMELGELTPEQVGEVLEQQTLQSQMMLDQFTQQGFITRDGENYRVNASFKNGALLMNGKPLQMM